MKRIYIFIPAIPLYLISCENPAPKQTPQVDPDSLLSLIVKEMDPDQPKPILWKRADWYKVESKGLCDEQNGIFLDPAKMKKYGRGIPFDTVIHKQRDSAIISFDFISSCCLEFSGEIFHRNDTLFLGYGPTTNILHPCDCYCDYRMTYRIHTAKRPWKKIIIKKGRL